MKSFFTLCEEYQVSPANACVQFGQSHPDMVSVALSTSKPERVSQNIALITTEVPQSFWARLKAEGLLGQDYAQL